MSFILIGVPFIRSFSNGWRDYYHSSEGPKFTEEQIRIADATSEVLDACQPVTNFLDPFTHMSICSAVNKDNMIEAGNYLEPIPSKQDDCLIALKITESNYQPSQLVLKHGYLIQNRSNFRKVPDSHQAQRLPICLQTY